MLTEDQKAFSPADDAFVHGHTAFRHFQTLLIQSRNLVPSRHAISWRGLFTFHQPIAGLLGTKFLPWMNKVSTCRKDLLRHSASHV